MTPSTENQDPITVTGGPPRARLGAWRGCAVPSAAVVGPMRRATWLRFQGTIDQVNISFIPGAAGAFVGLPVPELVGQMAAPDGVWPRAFRQAVAELAPLPAGQRIGGLAELVLAGLEPAKSRARRSGRRSG